MLRARPENLNARVVCNGCRHGFVARAEDGEPVYSPRLAAGAQRRGESVSAVVSATPGAAVVDADAPARRARNADGPAIEDLRGEVDALRARLEPLAARAREADRLEGGLREANAEIERLRLTVKILQADLFTRAGDVEQLEAGRSAAVADSTRLRAALADLERALNDAEARHEALQSAHARLLEEERAGWERERRALAARAEQLGAELDAARRQEEASREERARQQAESAQLRAEIEQQRQRREAERQAQQEALAALRQTLAERLQSRTATPPDGISARPA